MTCGCKRDQGRRDGRCARRKTRAGGPQERLGEWTWRRAWSWRRRVGRDAAVSNPSGPTKCPSVVLRGSLSARATTCQIVSLRKHRHSCTLGARVPSSDAKIKIKRKGKVRRRARTHMRALREFILRIRVPRGWASKRKTDATKDEHRLHQHELLQTCLHVQTHASKDRRRVCERGKKEPSIRRGLETKEEARESPVARW